MAQNHGWLTERAIAIVAEDKIRAAQDAGQFDKLPGFGKPHPIIDEEYDPHWWIRRKLAREQLNVPALQARQMVDGA